jgi:zinc transporter ZupT
VFFIELLVSLVVVVGAVKCARRLARNMGDWNAWLASGAAGLLVLAIADMLLPAVQEVPADFSAVVLWKFRIVSLGLHALIWIGTGLLFGILSEYATDRIQKSFVSLLQKRKRFLF